MAWRRWVGGLMGMAVVLGYVQESRGGGIYFPYLGARAAGMGGAFVARADDASTLFHNPAGMLILKESELSANIHLNIPDFEYTRKDGGVVFPSVGLETALNPQPFFGYVARRPDQRYAVGLGVYAAWGGLPDYPDDGPQRYHLDYLHLVIVHNTLAGAFQVADGLYLGAGASLIYASLGQRKSIDARDLLGLDERVTPGVDDPDNEIIATVTTKDWTFGGHFGVLYQPAPTFRIGASYTLPTTIGFHGTIQSDVSRVVLLSALIGEEINAEADVKQELPQVFRAGIAFAPVKSLSVAADWTWQDWSVSTANVVNIADQPLLEVIVGAIEIPRQWEDSMTFSFGLEYKLGHGHAVRAGYFFDQGAIPTSTVTVDDPDSDKSSFSAGATVRMSEQVLLDLAAEYRKYDDIEVTDSVYDFQTHPFPNYIGASTDGTYKSSILGFSAGIRYRFKSGGL